MDENVARVLRGYLNLNEVEKNEFLSELRRYESLQYDFQKNALKEQVEKRASVGPKNEICTCCGR